MAEMSIDSGPGPAEVSLKSSPSPKKAQSEVSPGPEPLIPRSHTTYGCGVKARCGMQMFLKIGWF